MLDEREKEILDEFMVSQKAINKHSAIVFYGLNNKLNEALVNINKRFYKLEKEINKMKKPKLGSGGRFKAGVKKLEAKGKSEEQAKGIMAAAGRKKYGAKKMAKMAAAGRRK